MQTLRDIAPYLAAGAVAADVVLLVLVCVLLVRVRRLRRAQQVVLGTRGERDIVAHTSELEDQVRNLREAVEILDRTVAGHKAELDHAFTCRAVVRYDAFRDIGGEQSASVAVLDRHRSGFVLSSIHSRDYARMYVKQLRDGVPDRALSPEEIRVVEAALETMAGEGRDEAGAGPPAAGADVRRLRPVDPPHPPPPDPPPPD